MTKGYTFIGACGVLITCAWQARADETAAHKHSMIAGKAEILRAVPKRFARLTDVDAKAQRVTLLVEGEALPKVWQLDPDAEVKIHGWWGRLDQLKLPGRVWVWFHLDRKKQPISILMLCDELSEQDIHGGVIVESADEASVTVKPESGTARKLKLGAAELYRGKEKAPAASLIKGERLLVESFNGEARLLLDGPAFEQRRAQQQVALRKRWIDQGLPATLLLVHLSGEMEVLLDHEAMRWARALKPGGKATLMADPPIPCEVHQVRPWRERTVVRLVYSGFDAAELRPGQRLHLRTSAPPAEVEAAQLPPDLLRPRAGKDERIAWFLASVYCPCKVKGDGCTGDFYTLASCNPNACGMPNHFRQTIGKWIDEGLSDSQIFEKLLKDHGPERLLRPHLVP